MFHNPEILWLLLLLIPLGWLKFRHRRSVAVEFSTTRVASQFRPTLRQRLIWLPDLLLLLAIGMLITALAAPRSILEQTVSNTDGIAIELVVDLSGSMQARDFQKNDQPVDRLTAIKDVVERFLLGDKELSGRPNDLIGLVTFARYADRIVPPTMDHQFLVSRLNEVQIVGRRSEDGTAIGDALGLATEKLVSLRSDQEREVKSKIVILLTDGENNAGELEPLMAAELAQAVGIKVYTIGVGSRGMAPFPVIDPFSGRERFQMMEVSIDEDTLEQIAEATGGRYFRATDSDSLAKIYQEIDQLEKSQLEDRVYTDYRELAIQTIRWHAWEVWPLAAWTLIFLTGHLFLSKTVFREFGT